MDSPKKMDIAKWDNFPLPMVPKKRVRRRFLPPTLIGILGTLLLHAMLIQSVSFGNRRLKQQLPDRQNSAELPQETTASDRLVLLVLPTNANQEQTYIQSLVSSLPDLRESQPLAVAA